MMAMAGMAGMLAVPIDAAPPMKDAPAQTRAATFISPMGEPFRSEAGEPAPDLAWFRKADADHDGKLTLTEMRLDARRFFATLDTNHDGEIDPEELRHYETDVAPEIGVVDFSGRGEGDGEILSSDSGPQDAFSDLPQVQILHRGKRADNHRGAGQFAYFDLPEPVVAADSDFNRGVSVREFDAAAQRRFQLLDTAHDGYLSYAKLQDFRH